MHSMLKNVCKLKVPLKIVENPQKPCTLNKTGNPTVCPSINLNSSRFYVKASNKEQLKNGLSTLQALPKFPCGYRRGFAQRTRHPVNGRTPPPEENDKKQNEVEEEPCVNPKSDRKEKKCSKSLRFTMNLNEILCDFSKKDRMVKAQGVNKINTFYLKPSKCKWCTSRKKKQFEKFQQKRNFSFSSKWTNKEMKVCGYPIGKIRNLLTFKEQSGGGVSYKIKETYRAREGNKFLKVPLFYILKEKVHSDSPVLQELGKRLRYQIGTNQAFFEKLPSSSVLTIDDNFKNNRDSEIPSHIKSKQEDKLRLLTSEVTKIISDNKLNLDNIKRNYVLQMLSEVLIPLIEKKSVQYEEMRKVFINLQKELEVFLNEMKSRRKRSENEIFRIISNINQAKRQQRDLESFTTVAAESEVNQKFDSVYTPRHKKCLYGTYPGKTTKKICTPNSQLDEFPIAILVKDEDKPKEIQNIPYISMSNSTKGSIKGHSSENENKRIALRNYTSDSKSTKKCIQDDLEQSFRSYNQEGGVGYFDNFQKHYIPRPITQTPKEQFTIPGESNFKRNSPKRKSKQFISDALKTTSRKEESTVNLKDNNSLAIVDDKNKPTFSQNSPYLTSKKKVDTTTARIPQATLSKAGMDNLKKLEQIVNPSQNEARLPFDDEVSTRSTALESKSLKRNISKQPSTMLSSKSDTKLSTELAMSKPVQPLRNFEPMPSLKNEWKPKKISKSISSPILKTVPAVSEKTPSTQLKCCEKSASISLLENCRGILENILRKLKGPPKRSLGSYRSEESISNYKGCDTASKENESESKSQSKLKYPWNHVVLTRNLNSGSKRAYSTTSRKYPYFKKGL